VDDEDDYAFPTWAGVIPLEMVAGKPVNDPKLDPVRDVPLYASQYSRRK
jgi:hypothetical protein